MILRRRLWSLCAAYLLALASAIWFGGPELGWGAGARTVALTLIFVTAGGFILLTEACFMRPLRGRLRRLDNMVRTMDPAPPPPRVRGSDEIETLRADLRRLFRRFDETRGDLAAKRLRAEVDSRTDPLTKLYNHRSFARFLADEWERARRARAPLSMLILDVDRFKSINDDLGHLVGNQVLEKAAALIKESIRPMDLAFRYAGDEFAVILPKTGLEQAVSLAEKIRLRVHNAEYEGLGDRRASFSIGAAEMTAAMRTPEDFVKVADQALYQSKEAGRNAVSYPAGRGYRTYRKDGGE
ncbi:MAG: GGDEF domain-containing protein [Bacteroidota bacterium]